MNEGVLGHGPRKVLVVDDHVDTVEILAILFRMLGHEPWTLTRGRDVLPAVRLLDPDVIVLDIGLPDLSGYEVVRALRREGGRRRYIVAATGWGRAVDRERARAAGFDHHVTKPIDVGHVRAMLARASEVIGGACDRPEPVAPRCRD